LTVVGVGLVVGLIIAGLLLTHVFDHGALVRWDTDVEVRLAEHRTELQNTLARAGTWLAETVPVLVVLLAAIIVAWRTSTRIAAPVFLVVAVGGEKLIYLIVSIVVGRSRPPVPSLGFTYATKSFPSGHVASAITLYGSIALLVALQRSSALRRALLLAVGVVAAIVAYCRMYRGFHYPTDVIAGAVLGVAWLTVTYYAVLRPDRPNDGDDSVCRRVR
jgi:undecaprenyl-diphosphatase